MRRDVRKMIAEKIYDAIIERGRERNKKGEEKFSKLLDQYRQEDSAKEKGILSAISPLKSKIVELEKELKDMQTKRTERATKESGYVDPFTTKEKAWKLSQEAEFELALMDAKGFNFERFLRKYLAK